MNLKEALKKFKEREAVVKEREKEEREERKRRLSLIQKLSIAVSVALSVLEGALAFSREMLPLYVPMRWAFLDPESIRQKVGIGWGIYYYKGGETQIRFLPQTTVLFYVAVLVFLFLASYFKKGKKNQKD